MPQNEPVRLRSREIPQPIRDALRDWRQNYDGDYSEDEKDLHCAVALQYASPRLFSISQLYERLSEMVEEDELLVDGCEARLPSRKAFRRLVLSLPAQFIDEMSLGDSILSRLEIMKAAGIFADDCSL
jgi:hypothetical protein